MGAPSAPDGEGPVRAGRLRRRLKDMIPFIAGVAHALSRKLVEHQDRPRRDANRIPLSRLLLDEAVYLLRRVTGARRSDD